jgi:hypothetical protein
MYLERYGLKLKPFEIDPDPKFLWLGKKHQEAFAALKNVILIISENALLSGYALNTKKSARKSSWIHRGRGID